MRKTIQPSVPAYAGTGGCKKPELFSKTPGCCNSWPSRVVSVSRVVNAKSRSNSNTEGAEV